jgi:hypothetical protein
LLSGRSRSHTGGRAPCAVRAVAESTSRDQFSHVTLSFAERRKPAAPVPGQLPTPTGRPSPLDPGTRGRSQCLSRRLLASQYTHLESKATAGAPMQGRPCWDSYVSAKCTSAWDSHAEAARVRSAPSVVRSARLSACQHPRLDTLLLASWMQPDGGTRETRWCPHGFPRGGAE